MHSRLPVLAINSFQCRSRMASFFKETIRGTTFLNCFIFKSSINPVFISRTAFGNFLEKKNVKLIRALIELKKNNSIEIPVFFEKLFNAIYQCLWVKINPKSFSPSLASILLCFIYFINLLHSLEVSLRSVETGEVCKGIIKELLRSLKDLLT